MAIFLKFPKGFLWGTSTSAYQIEGGIENCDWSNISPAGAACDHYHRYQEDFDLVKELNQNVHRFSIEWSRIEPRKGEFDQKEILHYRRVLEVLKSRGIKTMITLHYFTTPLWLVEIGGWSNPKVVFYFSCFTTRMSNEYQDLADFWITINEPLIYAAMTSYLQDKWQIQKKHPILFLKVIRNQIAAHRKTYKLFHRSKNIVQVGIAKNNCYFEPYQNKLINQILTFFSNYFWNEYFLNQIRNHQDFIGLNYYFHNRVNVHRTSLNNWFNQNENKIVSDMGWEIYPKGIYHVLKKLKKYQRPIYITENGIADARDILRKDFIKNHLFWIHKAIEEGIDIRGYLHWSLIDNFEWNKKIRPRFGLIEIDYNKGLKRIPRPSAKFYAKICRENELRIL